MNLIFLRKKYFLFEKWYDGKKLWYEQNTLSYNISRMYKSDILKVK